MIKNYATLPIYDSKDLQFRFRPNCEGQFNDCYVLPNNFLPPFAFRRDKYWEGITALEIFDLNDTLVYNYPDLNTILTLPVGELDYFINPITPLPSYFGFGNDGVPGEYKKLSCGYRYIKITCGTKVYYSEVFRYIEPEFVLGNDEKVINGQFSNALGNWTLTGIWFTDGTGYAQLTVATSGVVMEQAFENTKPFIYEIQFTISDIASAGSPLLSVITESGRLLVNANGIYRFYSTDLRSLTVDTTNTTFKISDISARPVLALNDTNESGMYSELVQMIFYRKCRGVNQIEYTDDEDLQVTPEFYDFLFLYAKILAPAYGEEIIAAENRNIEKINTFARSWKKHELSPMMLPEHIIDTLAQVNTFNNVWIGEKLTGKLYQYTDDEFPLSINEFEFNNEWAEGECYGICTLSFIETTDIKRDCCNSVERNICGSFPEALEIENANPANSNFRLVSTTPDALPDNAWVELFSVEHAGDCDSAPPFISTGNIITGQEFNENGISAYLPAGVPTCFYVGVYYLNCDTPIVSNKVKVEV